MAAEDLALARGLLRDQRLLGLAVLVDGEPCSGLLPFAAAEDLRAVFVHTSRLARHSRGLRPGSPFSAVIHAPDGPEIDPLQVPRLFLEGEVEVLERGSVAYAAARDLYVAKLPSAAPIFSLGDFELARLVIARARVVAGFARAVRLDPEKLSP